MLDSTIKWKIQMYATNLHQNFCISRLHVNCASGTLHPAPRKMFWGLISTKQQSTGDFYHSSVISLYVCAHHEPVEPVLGMQLAAVQVVTESPTGEWLLD